MDVSVEILGNKFEVSTGYNKFEGCSATKQSASFTNTTVPKMIKFRRFL